MGEDEGRGEGEREGVRRLGGLVALVEEWKHAFVRLAVPLSDTVVCCDYGSNSGL